MFSFYWPIDIKVKNQTIIDLPFGIKLIKLDSSYSDIQLCFDDSGSIVFLFDFECIQTSNQIRYNSFITQANKNLTVTGSVKVLVIPKDLIDSFEYDDRYINESYASLIASILNGLSEERKKVEIETITVINVINISLYNNNNNKNNIFEKSKMLILKNIDNPHLSLDFLADQLCVSRRKLQYIFNENGTSYNLLVGKIRLNIISENINRNYELSSKELGRISGFNSVQSLNRFFYKYCGLSIKEYKKKVKSFTLGMTNDIPML
ncbi:helix-turn-helix domain-containing protein [Photobacterium phosphoreum]|uniref:helix-turn-helix domain-containing protein n=1 Tax=Photobacterium phosphoreum TaxID=659 RepID=UPI0024B6BDD9|nr:AraC family transcriptional regulator [Photobacterium phosphoreum]